MADPHKCDRPPVPNRPSPVMPPPRVEGEQDPLMEEIALPPLLASDESGGNEAQEDSVIEDSEEKELEGERDAPATLLFVRPDSTPPLVVPHDVALHSMRVSVRTNEPVVMVPVREGGDLAMRTLRDPRGSRTLGTPVTSPVLSRATVVHWASSSSDAALLTRTPRLVPTTTSEKCVSVNQTCAASSLLT